MALFPCSPKQNLDLLCSLFPKIACVPLFPLVLGLCSPVPMKNCHCSPVPQNPWEGLNNRKKQIEILHAPAHATFLFPIPDPPLRVLFCESACLQSLSSTNVLCLHVVNPTVHSRKIMDSLIMAKYCRCILTVHSAHSFAIN